MSKMTGFFGLTRDDIRKACLDLGASEQHIKTLMVWAYKGFYDSWREEVSVSRKLLSYARDNWSLDVPEVALANKSRYDRSVKFLLQMADGEQVEAVLMPETNRLTLCLSSQVGCAQKCGFCYTGRMGLKRQLSTHEIVGQVIAVNRWILAHPDYLKDCRLEPFQRVSNIVFMGMGEPLDNTEALIPALQVMADDYALQLAQKRMAVSTAGHLDGLKALLKELPHTPIAFSLHAVDSSARSRLMPINRRYDFRDILDFMKEHYHKSHQKGWLLIQFTLISGVNDDLDTARKLAQLVADMPVKINLIPLNEIDPSRFESPEAKRLLDFRDVIHRAGVRVMIRYSKGQDINAACGQLVVNGTSQNL